MGVSCSLACLLPWRRSSPLSSSSPDVRFCDDDDAFLVDDDEVPALFFSCARRWVVRSPWRENPRPLSEEQTATTMVSNSSIAIVGITITPNAPFIALVRLHVARLLVARLRVARRP